MYARRVKAGVEPVTTAAAGLRPARTARRRSATGAAKQRQMQAIREQGQAVADHWKELKARST